MDSYTTARDMAEFTYEEKRSVFIGCVAPCSCEEEALAFLAMIKSKYPEAKHHTYAYSLRENNICRYSDDHEPQGTAGIPILQVLKKNECTDTIIVVVRYFGGVLLGTGGLLRAYTAAAAGALREASTRTFRQRREFTVTLNYQDHNRLLSELSRMYLTLKDTTYGVDVVLHFSCPEEHYENNRLTIMEVLGGRCVFQKGDLHFSAE